MSDNLPAIPPRRVRLAEAFARMTGTQMTAAANQVIVYQRRSRIETENATYWRHHEFFNDAIRAQERGALYHQIMSEYLTALIYARRLY